MYFVREIERIVDFYSNSIGNVLAFGDFNMEESHPCIQSLIQQYSLYNLIRSPTCFKRVPGKCIDLMLTNTKHSFFGSQTMEMGFSDFHHMIYIILKTTFNKVPPKIIEYRDYSKFSEEKFLTDLSNVVNREIPADYDNLESLIQRVLEQHAPTKKATSRGIINHMFRRNLEKKLCIGQDSKL